jgi:hypothetical protein
MKPSSARCAETSSAGLSMVGIRASSRSSHRFLLSPSSPRLQQSKPSLLHSPNLLHRPRPSHPLPPGCARSRSCAAAKPTYVCEPVIKKADWNARFNQAWEKLAPTSRKPPAAGYAAPRRPEHLARKSARTLRAELRASSSVRDRPAQFAIEPPGEAIQRFNRFWDSLLTARHRAYPAGEASSILAQPLPPSLSLVPVETPEEA